MIPLRTPEEAARTAERHNRRLAQRFPLLADQLDLLGAWTAERVMEAERRYRAQLEAADRAAWERGDQLRDLVAERVAPEELETLTAYCRRVYPPTSGYWADFWWQQLKMRCPEAAWAHCPQVEQHAALVRYGPRCPICGCPVAADGGTP